jgi:hypothetical protein
MYLSVRFISINLSFDAIYSAYVYLARHLLYEVLDLVGIYLTCILGLSRANCNFRQFRQSNDTKCS